MAITKQIVNKYLGNESKNQKGHYLGTILLSGNSFKSHF